MVVPIRLADDGVKGEVVLRYTEIVYWGGVWSRGRARDPAQIDLLGGRAHRRQTGWRSDCAVGWRGSGGLRRGRRCAVRVDRFDDVVVRRRSREAGIGVGCTRQPARNQRGRIRSRAAVDAVGADGAVSRRSNCRPAKSDDARRRSPSPSARSAPREPWCSSWMSCQAPRRPRSWVDRRCHW